MPVLGVLFTPKAQQQPKKEVARKHDKLEESWINKWRAIVESKVCFTPQIKHGNASKPSKLTIVSNATVKSMSSIEALTEIKPELQTCFIKNMHMHLSNDPSCWSTLASIINNNQ